MSTDPPGFHPIQRLVHRLAQISPHRQVQLLCAISVVTVVVMMAAVLGSLAPTRNALRVSNDRLLPAIQPLDAARQSYNDAANAFVLASDADGAVRATGITKLAAANSGGSAAWKAYLVAAVHLSGERALQRAFVTHRKAAFDAGLVLVGSPPSAEALANITQLSNAIRNDLNQIKDLYEAQIRKALGDAKEQVGATGSQIKLISGAAILILLLAFGVAARSARSREERLEVLDEKLHEDAARNALEAQLQRSLEMARTEAAAYELTGRALSINLPGLPAELLVADSSRAHFRQTATTDEADGPRCSVMAPTDCPAATWGQTQTWNSSTELDACPHLQGRATGDCSAVCVPVSIGGKTIGVVHATAPDNDPPDDHSVVRIELIARKVGERVGMLRAFLRSETQAHTDPLTGLMNRRSLEEEVRRVAEDGRSFVAAYGDLDHFKQLNDVHGHDAGDQALRLFSRVLRDTVRPNDLIARYGGEEFVIVLPECQVSDAYTVVNRVREHLALAQAGGHTPPFTVSFGITAARPENTFSETLEIADAALLKAKATGRDRVVISGIDGAPPASGDSAVPDLSDRTV